MRTGGGMMHALRARMGPLLVLMMLGVSAPAGAQDAHGPDGDRRSAFVRDASLPDEATEPEVALGGAAAEAPRVGAGLSGGLVGASILCGIGLAGLAVGIGLFHWVDGLPRCTGLCLFDLWGEWIAASVTLGASGMAALIGLIWLGVELGQREAALLSQRRASVTLDAAVGPDRGVLFVRSRF